MKRYLFSLLIISIVILSSCQVTDEDVAETGSDSIEILAKCLTENGAVMYGADWCQHCNNQKEMFGDAVKYITYVECTEEQQTCSEAGVQGYPTWIFADGSSVAGAQQLGTLAAATACDY
jgi:thioredoxin-related protein